MTPVVTAQLDDPYCLDGMHHWLANWQLRALTEADARGSSNRGVARLRNSRARRSRAGARRLRHALAARRQPAAARADRRRHRRTARRPAGPSVPAAADPRLREFALREGLADARQRFAHTPTGIWAPECAYAPGMEHGYAAAGVGHFMVDGPSLHGDTALGRPVGDSDVVAFGRDLQVSYRVWSPKSGYPGHAAYRDFHTYDHATGLKPARVTGRNVPSDDKAPYDPQRADARRRRPRRRLRRGGAPAPAHRVGAHRPARARRRRVRHRTLRALVVRGAGVAGAGVARAARGGHRVGTLSDAVARGLHRCTGRIAAQLLGFRQGLAGVVGRTGRRSGAAEHRGRRHRAEHGGQGAGADRAVGAPSRATSSPTRSCARRC